VHWPIPEEIIKYISCCIELSEPHQLHSCTLICMFDEVDKITLSASAEFVDDEFIAFHPCVDTDRLAIVISTRWNDIE